MSQRKRLALVDGHALAFRAFHALKEQGFRSSSGEPTWAVFAFAQILLTTLQEQRPDYVAISFDVGRTFRDEMYAEYKAGRAETPAEFHPQLERIKQLVGALNIPVYVAEGFEADDVIGTLARQATAHDVETLILTGDTDTLQLVDGHVRVILANPYGSKTTTTVYDDARVRERYEGLAPAQLADLRGLKGDVSDNIPGVKGIGEKGAINLLKQFGTVEHLYEHLDEVPNRYRKALDGQRESAEFSKKLATIVCDAPVQLDLRAATIGDYDRAAVIALFQELEIGASSNLIKKLPATTAAAVQEQPLPAPSAEGQLDLFAAPAAPAPVDGSGQLALFDLPPAAAPPPAGPNLGSYRAITAEPELVDLLAALAAAPGFAFDTESDGLRPFESEIVGVSVSLSPGSAVYIPFGHRQGEQLPRARVLDALRPFFKDPQKAKYAHNAKFDIELLLSAGVPVRGLAFDTMLAAGLLGKRAGLKDLAFYELQLPEPMTPIEELIGRGSKQITFGEVPIDAATPYAAADADMTMRLVGPLRQQIAENERLQAIFRDLEMPLVEVLVSMEQAGITLDKTYIEGLGAKLSARIEQLAGEIYAMAGRSFNINSGQQLNEVLFDSGKFGLDPRALQLSKLKSGGYSITAEVLEQMAPIAPIAEKILQYRQLSKLKSTYIDALPQMVNHKTGRVHTSYSQLGAATGRLSSIDPNLQNIPVRTEEGREIRRGFVAAAGCQLVAADYSQIELRVLAHVTKDPNLLQAFQEGYDIHAATASQLFGVPIAKVDKNQRRVAKTVVFGVIYGISAFGLAQRLHMERSYAQSLINTLFERYPGLKAYIDSTLELGRRDGYVYTLYGRRRPVPDLRAGGPRRAAAEREAINAPIQGTAADIMKLAMVNMHRALKERDMRTRMLLQVHDELILEAPEDEVDAACELVREVMEHAAELEVPLGVDVETGLNWEEMK